MLRGREIEPAGPFAGSRQVAGGGAGEVIGEPRLTERGGQGMCGCIVMREDLGHVLDTSALAPLQPGRDRDVLAAP